MAPTDKPAVNMIVRVNIALALVAAGFFIIALRLYFLQVLKGDVYRVRSENNRIRTVYVSSPRGLIFDRQGRVLVQNRPAFNVEYVAEDAIDPKKTLANISELLEIDPSVIRERLSANTRRRRFEPKILLKDVSRDIVAEVSSHRHVLPGVVINVDPARKYLFGDLAAHVIGYIREITQPQLENPAFAGYRNGDVVGQYGLEARWEHFLQGQRGIQDVIVDAMGNRIGESSFQEQKPGNNITLTLDLDIQRAADEAFADKAGALVAMNPKTGEVLALTSAPRFDPNIFVGEVPGGTWKDLVTGKEKRLSDRAIQGAYPPGSVFKILMSIAALSEGVIRPGERVGCPGFYPFAGRNYRCHKKSGHGSVDLFEAMVQSCDVFYYTVGNRLGVDRIHDYASRFGLGDLTGVELGHEAKGLVPSTAWRRASSTNPERQKWYPGETLSVAIGQGAVTTTPIQIARALSAVVNGGTLLRPYLVRKVTGSDGTVIEEHPTSPEARKVDVSPKILDTVREAMVGVVNDPRGTGKHARLKEEFPYKVGGKTGTAQVVSLDISGKRGEWGDHAWFAGYAPADDPQIVAVALVEHGGHGGSAAAPLVKKVLDAYFETQKPKADPSESSSSSSSASAGGKKP